MNIDILRIKSYLKDENDNRYGNVNLDTPEEEIRKKINQKIIK